MASLTGSIQTAYGVPITYFKIAELKASCINTYVVNGVEGFYAYVTVNGYQSQSSFAAGSAPLWQTPAPIQVFVPFTTDTLTTVIYQQLQTIFCSKDVSALAPDHIFLSGLTLST